MRKAREFSKDRPSENSHHPPQYHNGQEPLQAGAVFSEDCVRQLLATLDKTDEDSIPLLVEAVRWFINPSTDGKNICNILEGLDHCSKKYNISPVVLAETAAPLFVDGINTVEVKTLLTLGRLGNPEEVAYAHLFLASNEAAYITGQSIVVDGGQLLPESHHLEY